MKIVVTGEACEDVFIYGDCKRLCPEGPVPVFAPQERHTYKGMAANTRENMNNIWLNGGGYRNPAVTRNIGCRTARGQILIMQSDDVLHESI